MFYVLTYVSERLLLGTPLGIAPGHHNTLG